MPFSSAVKLEAKAKANYTCCWCRVPGTVLNVHHIHPEADSGSNLLDNAAVLCPTCHYTYGHKAEFEEQMRERRDQWDRNCAERFRLVDREVLHQLDSIQARLSALEESKQITNADVAAAFDASGNLLPRSATTDAERATTGAVLTATANIAATYFSYMGGANLPLKCRACGIEHWDANLTTDDPCPFCGAHLFVPGSSS